MSTDNTWLPTRASTGIALAVAIGTVALLLLQVRLVIAPALVGSAGALGFAASLWLASRERVTAFSATVISLLTVPVAVGILVGTAGTILVLVGRFFPVDTTSQLSAQSLLVIARVGIVAGAVLAVFGLTLGIRNVVDGETLVKHYWVTIKTAVVPAGVGAVMVAGAVLANGQVGPAGQPDPIGSSVDGLLQWLLSPGTGAVHLSTFLFLVMFAVTAVRAAVRALPVAELLADSGVGETRERRVETLLAVLGWIVTVAGIGALIALVVELSTTPAELAQRVGPELVRQVFSISTATGLRLLLVGLIVVPTLTVLVVKGLRRLARSSAGSALRRIAPLVGGGLLTAAAVTFATPVLSGLLSWVEAQLPPAFADPFRQGTIATVQYYGAPAMVVVLVASLVALTAAVVLTFRLGLFLGYLSGETAGYALASGGLFVASAFAGVIEAPIWLVFGGLVASLLVWDAGQYGTALGREIGRYAPTRNAELVHVGGTLAVGAVGAGLAFAINVLLDGWDVAGTSLGTVALAGVLAGMVLLVTALR